MHPCMPGLAQVLAVALTQTASAQAPVPLSDTSVVPWSALSERPRLLDTASAREIRFPPIMRDASVNGEVRLAVIIDRDGVPERGSIRVATSTHDLFTLVARSAVGRWRLSPPVLDGRNVRTVVPVMLTFILATRRSDPSLEVASIAIDTTGIHVSVGDEPIARDSSIAANPADVRAATVAALAELMPAKTAAIEGAVCVGWDDSSRKVPADVMTRLRALYPPLRNADQCPPTYTSMILQVDSLGRPLERPPGAVDPLWIEVNTAQVWTRDLYVVRGAVGRGTSTSHYQCTAHREPANGDWKAKCMRTGMSIS
jgi:hypothetical protein